MNAIETALQEARKDGVEYLDEIMDADPQAQFPPESVWKRVEQFLHAMSVTAVGHALEFELPQINVCPNRSIDLYWRDGYTLLMNFSETGLGYYGDTKDNVPPEEGSQTIKGTLKSVEDSRRLLWLLFWMRDVARK